MRHVQPPLGCYMYPDKRCSAHRREFGWKKRIAFQSNLRTLGFAILDGLLVFRFLAFRQWGRFERYRYAFRV